MNSLFRGMEVRGKEQIEPQKPESPEVAERNAEKPESMGAPETSPRSEAAERAIKDDSGNVFNEGTKLRPNDTFKINGIEYKTDDNRNIYCIANKVIARAEFSINGHIYEADDTGHIYRVDCEFAANDSFTLYGVSYHTDSNRELLTDERTDRLSEVSSGDGLSTNEASEKMARTPSSHGVWDGERGNSIWCPDAAYIPPEKSKNPDRPYSNPDQLSWGQLFDKYEIDGISFQKGFPDFSEISRGTVQIEGFETGGSVAKDRNFDKAYIAMAEARGCEAEEVKSWMAENNYTWHECEDKKTMQKVPHEIHANIPHDGGRSQHDE